MTFSALERPLRLPAKPDAMPPGVHRLAQLTTFCTVILIVAGALVTTTKSGLAVPDWPLSFGTLFPEMVGGVRYEHTHRLIAGSVALLTLVLGIWAVRTEPRRWVRILAWCAMGGVLVQALLGGLTVLLRLPTAVSASHGTLAQTWFCMIVALAMVTSPAWQTAPRLPLTASARWLRFFAVATTAAIWLQLVVGATMRHLGGEGKTGGLAIPDFPTAFGAWIPPVFTHAIAVNFAHTRVGALIVLILSLATVWCALSCLSAFAPLRDAALRLALLVGLQLYLGMTVIWMARPVLPTSLHVANGALVLVTSLVITLWSFRLFSAEREARS
ncbi:MAG: heme A synthase [Armatimonadetes bacterium]|nr:heme A synthase [Armatimonadota bacterium]